MIKTVRCKISGMTVKGEFISSSSTAIVMKSSFGSMVFRTEDWELEENPSLNLDTLPKTCYN